MTAPTESRPRDVARDEMTWRAHLVLAQLMHCRAVARLSAEQRTALEVDAGLSLGDSAETGQALLGLTPTEVVALAATASRTRGTTPRSAPRSRPSGTRAPPASSLGPSGRPSCAGRATS